MGMIEKIIHVDSDLRSLCELFSELKAGSDHPLPLRKVLYTLHRKNFLRTVAIERGPNSPQFEAECALCGIDASRLRRLHFFSVPLDVITSCAVNDDNYGGYCDLRPGDGSVVDAFITAKTIVNNASDGYAFLPVSMFQSVEVPCTSGSPAGARIQGFPYMQKNGRETMCAQAALLGLVRYWQFKCPGMFASVKTTVDINERVGFHKPEQTSAVGRGLSLPEISAFLSAESVAHRVVDYSGYETDRKKSERIVEDIYGYIESGCPVVAVIDVNADRHALSLIGHTFDKNNWQAMADVAYFGVMDGHSRRFHPNITWIHHLIIHDDNFGPHYFLDLEKLEQMIAGLVVVLPKGCQEPLVPSEASKRVAGTILDPLYREFLRQQVKAHPLSVPNQHWFDEFVRHLRLDTGNGLVLRPMLRMGKDVLEEYARHEFLPSIRATIGEAVDDYFWVVELSWPDIYCFHDATCGMALLRENGELLATHLPGMLILSQNPNNPEYVPAQQPDDPRPLVKPGLVRH